MSAPPVLSAYGLGKRYGSRWAVRGCTFEIPSGTVTALVGPNGAGKTTLLHLAVGLNRPSAGEARVFGHSPRGDATLVLPRVGFVAQEHPLHRGFSVGETLKLGRKLNPRWDDAVALARIECLGLSLGQKIGKLSGGQQAQVALTLALAKQPELLVLDEPIASLDPLARREFLQSVMQAVAETGLTVVLSSHIVADIERVCDVSPTTEAATTTPSTNQQAAFGSSKESKQLSSAELRSRSSSSPPGGYPNAQAKAEASHPTRRGRSR